MKPFDKAAAMRGAKVCTRDGYEARILCYDSGGVGYNEVPLPIIAEVFLEGGSAPWAYRENGMIDGTRETCYDLMMADDDYLEKLERGEYGNATRKVPAWQEGRIMTPDQIASQPFASIADEWYWRKMYAGMAMQGFMSDSAYKREVSNVCSGLENQMRIAAEMAVIAADALINELKKEKKNDTH